MRTWIAVIGLSPYPITNTIWAACKRDGYVPDHVVLVDPGSGRVDREELKASIRRILIAYGVDTPSVDTVSVDDSDFVSCRDRLVELVERTEGEIALDITSGRRLMATFAMGVGLKMKDRVKKIYYLPLKDDLYYKRPFMLIPARQHMFTEVNDLLGRGER